MGPGSTQVAPVTQPSSLHRHQQNGEKNGTAVSAQNQQQQQQLSPKACPATVHNHSHSHSCGHHVKDVCCILPSPVQSALEFVADMAQLLMPSLFMACPNGGCNLTRTLLDIASVRRNCISHKPLSESSSPSLSLSLSSSAESSPQLSEKQLADLEMASTASFVSVEPGDSFGFDHSTRSCACGCECCQSRCCFTSSTASVRTWRSIAWQTQSLVSLHNLLNSQRSLKRASVSQHIIAETFQLANKTGAAPTSSTGPAQNKSAAQERSSVPLGLLSSLAVEDDVQPPSYHNLSVNAGCFSNNASADKKHNVSGDSAQNNAAVAVVPHHHAYSATSEVPAPDADCASCIDQKLVEANRYLMRRVRKLEITNQIIKEAYDEVQEILLAERQSKATQLQALERKHQDDMLKLVEEYQKREGESGYFFGIDNELSNYDSGLSSSFESTRASRASTTKSVTAYLDNRNISLSISDIEFCDTESLSSDFSGHSDKNTAVLPQKVAGDASRNALLSASSVLTPMSHSLPTAKDASSVSGDCDAAATSFAANAADDDEDEDELDGISITWIREKNANPDADADTDADSESDSESDSDSSSSNEEDEDDFDDDDDDGWGDNLVPKVVAGKERCASTSTASNHQDSDKESDLDLSFDSEPETDLSNIFDRFNRDSEPYSEQSNLQPKVSNLQHLLSPEDYIGIDPAAAVINRYYANNNGTLDIAADIDDIPTDGYDRESHSEAIGDSYAESDAQMLDSLSPHSIWDAMRDSSTASVVEDSAKTQEDREMELIVQLPADQRIAKFVNRASSHLQQGARGGLSLGFMLHNLEILAAQFASNHVSILCAFIESLYRLTEAIGNESSDIGLSRSSAWSASDAAVTPPSALAKRLREDQQSRRLAVLRVVKLLHTFITLPDDQSTVLRLLEKLSEANQGTRLGIHALLLRTLYENELLDSGSINQWYKGQPAEQSAGLQHAHLIRKNAVPLLHQLAEDAASTALLMDEIQQQVLQTSGGTSNSTAMSTPSHMGSATRACWAGSLTPVSDENTMLTSQSSDSECPERSDDRAPASNSISNRINVLSISRKSSALLLSGSSSNRMARRLSDPSSPVIDCSRPTKQVTFAAV
ncbi:hypothetical protein FB639_000609 [Coemansia asiatica]|nr:hypothetical protein FB639_000609 [Coemansia asiatica]